MAFQDDSQASSPLVNGAPFCGGKCHGGLRQASAHCELATGPTQPSVEVGAIDFRGEHGVSRGSIAAQGQGCTHFRERPFFPAGYFTGFIDGAGVSFFNAVIWSRRWAARSNSSRDEASRISSSSSEITRSLS